jgi:hypothetical protein
VTESCQGCGFVWDAVAADEVGPGVRAATVAIAERVERAGAHATLRPSPDRWSVLEYAAHVRDVVTNVRDRIVQTLVEEEPTYAMLWRDERVEFGLYAGDDPAEVGAEVIAAGSLFARTFDRIDPALLARTGRYTYPVAMPRSVLWIAAQVLHECRHHLADIDHDLALLG